MLFDKCSILLILSRYRLNCVYLAQVSQNYIYNLPFSIFSLKTGLCGTRVELVFEKFTPILYFTFYCNSIDTKINSVEGMQKLASVLHSKLPCCALSTTIKRRFPYSDWSLIRSYSPRTAHRFLYSFIAVVG